MVPIKQWSRCCSWMAFSWLLLSNWCWGKGVFEEKSSFERKSENCLTVSNSTFSIFILASCTLTACSIIWFVVWNTIEHEEIIQGWCLRWEVVDLDTGLPLLEWNLTLWFFKFSNFLNDTLHTGHKCGPFCWDLLKLHSCFTYEWSVDTDRWDFLTLRRLIGLENCVWRGPVLVLSWPMTTLGSNLGAWIWECISVTDS